MRKLKKKSIGNMQAVLLIVLFLLQASADSTTPSSFNSMSSIRAVLESKINLLNKKKNYDEKVKILSDLKYLIDTETERVSDQADSLRDEIDVMKNNLESLEDSSQDKKISGISQDNSTATAVTTIATTDKEGSTTKSNSLDKDALTSELKEKQSKLDNEKDLIFEWNIYESKLEPLFDLFLDHRSSISSDPFDTTCDTIEADLKGKLRSNSNRSSTQIIQIAHDMCLLSR